MTIAMNLGFPRIGARRELKRALESFWAGTTDAAALESTARALRLRHWQLQRERGITSVPSNDFSLYDHVLDSALMVGAVPARYAPLAGDPLRTAFAMARGAQDARADVPAMEMTKWFDTNYHYIVPELARGMTFELASTKPVDDFLEARAAGVHTRPVLLGPVSFLLLGKMTGGSALDLLDGLLPAYAAMLAQLHRAGADWVQLDEPLLVMDLPDDAHRAYRTAYERLRSATGLRLLVATYFGSLDDNLALAATLPVDGLHVDLVRGPEQLGPLLAALPADRLLSAGVIDGRNIWRADLDAAFGMLQRIADARDPSRLAVAPSCSLLHCPVDLSLEHRLDPELKSWMAFATEKLGEVAALARAIETGDTMTSAFDESRRLAEHRRMSPRVHDAAVSARLRAVTAGMRRRPNPYARRRVVQQSIGLALLPTTTIGSFPQTAAVRAARAEFKAGSRSREDYERFLRAETERAIRTQEEIGLDVLVHGEFERNDMVEYFGEQLAGFAFTENGWVQSYGSRCVKPPVIYGDVARRAPMTVAWSRYAQSLTTSPVKGMLTGPVTLLQWSFVRDDQPRSVTCDQIALAIRDEVGDLEAAGLRIIQIDEPAIREGLPLRRAAWPAYLDWATGSFRLATAGVRDETQVHTHMCYAEFNDIIEAIAAMDADVVSMETSRSKMKLLGAFARFNYPNEVGPGVYDIHSPRVPPDEEMVDLLRRAIQVLHPRQIWVNPDCGLKTRAWAEVVPALEGMVRAARTLRAEVESFEHP